MASLPDDLLHMICASLWEERDFETLFDCACSGKQLAVPALASLYRMHDISPVTTGAGGDEVAHSVKGEVKRITKWARMWRSIIMSSLGKTMFPYAQFVRNLRLGDLQELLEEGKFRNNSKITSMFFAGEMGKYRVENSLGSKKSSVVTLSQNETMNAYAGLLLQHMPVLEELSGTLDPTVLLKAISHLPHLRHLNVFHGEALEGTGALIRQHCPHFSTLQCYGWSTDADQQFASFLSDLRPQSLQSFRAFSSSKIGTQSFLALNSHCESLSTLHLQDISAEAMPWLSNLKGCTRVKDLLLSEERPSQDLEKRHNDTFLEVVAWLRECTRLQEIDISKFLSAPSLLTPVMIEHSINLIDLTLAGYSMAESKNFHQALRLQPSLESLQLSGESNESVSDLQVLLESLCSLKNLKDLRLIEISDHFLDGHICAIAQNLSKLEVFWTGGMAITDEIWGDLSELSSLRQLEFSAETRFTMKRIVDFVEILGPGNKGFLLGVNLQEFDYDLLEVEQSVIRDTLSSRVEGRFDYQVGRDPNDHTYSDEDSD